MSQITREQALALLQKYNEEPFHILHALTVEGVMRYFAKELGYTAEEEFWGLCGLLHDVDFEKYPEAHCKKAPELLAEIAAPGELVHAVCSHAYGMTSDVGTVFLFIIIYLIFIYIFLIASGLSCSTQDLCCGARASQ